MNKCQTPERVSPATVTHLRLRMELMGIPKRKILTAMDHGLFIRNNPSAFLIGSRSDPALRFSESSAHSGG